MKYKITHLGVPESASIETPPFQTKIYLVRVPLNVNIVKQDLLNKTTVFEKFMKWGLKDSIEANSGPPKAHTLSKAN